MTTSTERTLATLSAIQLLHDIKSNADVPEKLRKRAEQVLRHFPKPMDLVSLASFCDRYPMGPHLFCANDPSTPLLGQLLTQMSKYDFK